MKIESQLPKNFDVKSAHRHYPVRFVDQFSSLCRELNEINSPVILIDANVKKLYGTQLSEILNRVPVLELEANEEAKTYEGIGKVIEWLSLQKCTKANHVIAIGGGIIQDIATFTTCIFFRGISWTLVPTTLLSMADSCIGAKCGINLGNVKNQLGVFNAPHAVLIAPEFLHTLSENDIKSGYGEILKLYLTDGYDKFLELSNELDRQGKLFSVDTVAHVAESLKIKRKVIEEDEYETYYRMILNYGHTLGHALESETSHFVPHGLGVAWGINFENFLAQRNGWLSKEKFEKIEAFIKKWLCFKNEREVSIVGLLAASRRDKKMTSASEVNLIFFTDSDELEIRKTAIDKNFEECLSAFLEKHDVFCSP